ncbi:hypothetical protein [Acinetobacter guerrae]|uniref:hypothetical protein n=1 Tax=Acinetobacter guerrae TaxID=1843371 RepID=UPI00128DF86D|nr:hypothetical protein [Acinetobacter guerrae]MPW44248.1 hypothetical protein [Acinetobacter guerrae]
MKKNYCIMFLFILHGCSDGKKNSSDEAKNINNEYELSGVKIGGNLEFLKENFKNDIIIQNYSDISDLKACENRKNILINNTLTSIDVDDQGIVTFINTRNSKAVDANNVSVGNLESSIKNLTYEIKSQKEFSGDDTQGIYSYKIPMKEKKGFFIYNIDNKRIDSITIESIEHISCYE